jgi:hypothetical protein
MLVHTGALSVRDYELLVMRGHMVPVSGANAVGSVAGVICLPELAAADPVGRLCARRAGERGPSTSDFRPPASDLRPPTSFSHRSASASTINA